MTNKLHLIQEKISSIKFALLRFTEGGKQQTLQARLVTSNPDSVNCHLIDSKKLSRLKNKRVNIIQKYQNDYLFGSGMVIQESPGFKILCIRLVKVSWFTKKSKGNVSWMQEVHKYDSSAVKQLKIA